MAKFLVSSWTCLKWLERATLGDGDYDIEYDGKRLYLGIDYIECEGKGKETITLSGKRIKEFIEILRLLGDQPILLIMENGRLWLWQCII